jgi:hypothetical protein
VIHPPARSITWLVTVAYQVGSFLVLQMALFVADFRNSTTSASPDQLDRDLAGALAARAVTVGAERAVGSAARSLDREVLAGALRRLQKPALDPALGRNLRDKRRALS